MSLPTYESKGSVGVMALQFLRWILGKGCSHRFGWPRIGAEGQHYQKCMLCGVAYEYDWEEMRRTERLFPHESTLDLDSVH